MGTEWLAVFMLMVGGGRRVGRPHLSEVQAKVDRYELQMRRPGLLSGYYGYRGKWSLVREPQTC